MVSAAADIGVGFGRGHFVGDAVGQIADGTSPGAEQATLAWAWQAMSGAGFTDDLLRWPPDLFALTNVLLARSEAFRFVLSPPAGAGWPPPRTDRWADAVVEAGQEWSAWVDDQRGSPPAILAEAWSVALERADLSLDDLAEGRDWPACEALLTLHAIADEGCAGLGHATESRDGRGARYRARARELLARTGSLARIPPRFLRVLPKIMTPPTGRAAFSRYACVQRPGLEARWHKMPARRPGIDPRAEKVNILLLPWPLRVRESDFRAVEGSVRRLEREPFGFFEFTPSERLDLDLVDRVLAAARDEAGSVDQVVLPECAIDESEIEGLESVLDSHGVVFLSAGVRRRPADPGRLGDNWVHSGLNPRMRKGGVDPDGPGRRWFHLRQNKHHRWSLDESQIYQYHLGGALHPEVLWWEAMEVPRRSVQFVEVAEEVTFVSLVCEDLAEADEVAEVIRSVGPTIVLTVLLDGPQLTSRWAARYASVFADEPGSAVLTLTSFGMVQRCRPKRHDAAPIVALWKDPVGGFREIPLESGAQGVLLTACGTRSTRRTADGRWPVDTGTRYFDVAVQQIRAADAGSRSPSPPAGPSLPAVLEIDDLTILTGWTEGVADVLAHAPERLDALLADARPDAAWRSAFGLAEPSPRLGEAIESLDEVIREAGTGEEGAASFDAVLAASCEDPVGDQPLAELVRSVLQATLEQCRSRRAAAPRADSPG